MKPIILKGRVRKSDRSSSTTGCSITTITIEQGVIIPALGVYLSETEVAAERFDSIAWINDGRDGESLSLEIHLINSEKDLVGKTISVKLIEKIRDVISFPGEEEMAKIIQGDLIKAKEWSGRKK
jgi:FAD synthase